MIDVGNTAKRDARRIEIAERRQEVLKLRRHGSTFEDIATKLGLVDKSHARKEFRAALREILIFEADEYRKMAEMRLDLLRKVLTKKVLSGDIQACREWRSIEADQARILGYEATGSNEAQRTTEPVSIRILLPDGVTAPAAHDEAVEDETVEDE